MSCNSFQTLTPTRCGKPITTPLDSFLFQRSNFNYLFYGEKKICELIMTKCKAYFNVILRYVFEYTEKNHEKLNPYSRHSVPRTLEQQSQGLQNIIHCLFPPFLHLGLLSCC
jgi:hypothetical protein